MSKPMPLSRTIEVARRSPCVAGNLPERDHRFGLFVRVYFTRVAQQILQRDAGQSRIALRVQAGYDLRSAGSPVPGCLSSCFGLHAPATPSCSGPRSSALQRALADACQRQQVGDQGAHAVGTGAEHTVEAVRRSCACSSRPPATSCSSCA